jgi:hypothetical protein
LLSQYGHIHAYLDNDEAGRNGIQTLKDCLGEKVIDHAADYSGCKDLNEFLVKNQQKMNNDNLKTTSNEGDINKGKSNREDGETGLHGNHRALHRGM